ncbi:MAG: polysaccharide biosynthesis protein [Oscillospiraceae bacterium]|nr:polysaccharide biosynthesis protein [Oscillospiraceae bacterium]
MSEQKKQSFLHGTMLLAMSTAIVKVIGAFYSIPLKAIIGDQGFGYYSTAYEIYTILLMISTAGLPVAMSRMISQANSLGHYRQVRKIYTVSRTIFLTLGLIGALLMTLFCKQLAAFQEQPDAWAAIGTLGPCCFLICLMSTYRGFFQGQSNMTPTSVSQVLEAVCKLIVGIAAAILIKVYTDSIPLAAGGAIFGVTVSCLISSFYLNRCFRRAYKDLPVSCEETSSGKDIAKGLLAIAVPITIGSAGLQILTVLETKIYMSQLLRYMTQEAADTRKGIYNFIQKIFNMPCAFITPITISAIPAITAQLTTKEFKAAKATEESAARVTGLISAPCAVGLAVLAGPVAALLGGYTGEKLALATQLMVVLGICIVFNAIVLLTNAIMQAHGHVNLPVTNMLIGGVLKLAAIYILTGNPNIGILGTPIGSLMCYICITLLNLISIRRVFSHPPAVIRNMLRSVLAALIMGAAVYGTWYGLKLLLGADMSRVIACGVPILVGVAVYVAAAVKLRAITREDCLLLPKGKKIADILHL